jgi:hypothetical protein
MAEQRRKSRQLSYLVGAATGHLTTLLNLNDFILSASMDMNHPPTTYTSLRSIISSLESYHPLIEWTLARAPYELPRAADADLRRAYRSLIDAARTLRRLPAIMRVAVGEARRVRTVDCGFPGFIPDRRGLNALRELRGELKDLREGYVGRRGGRRVVGWKVGMGRRWG